MDLELQHHYIKTNGITLHAVIAGPEDGPLLIFLHGFPEFWFGWRKQIDFFANAGYRVMAPDQRGYNLSDKPKGIAAYNLDHLAADGAGREKAFLVGHDWGGVVAWWTAIKHPERLERLAILNCPHPRVMRQNVLDNAAQRRKSWYIFFFQLPWLPEWRARRHNWRLSARALQGTSRPQTFSDADLQLYRQAWSQPGAYTSMIHWYRAMLQNQPKKVKSPRVTVSTLLIWGARDRFLGREMAQPSIDLCDNGRLEFIEEASHWLQHEEPERVNQLLQSFFSAT